MINNLKGNQSLPAPVLFFFALVWVPAMQVELGPFSVFFFFFFFWMHAAGVALIYGKAIGDVKLKPAGENCIDYEKERCKLIFS